MLSHPKYRHKEEKRKLMKMTCKKLKRLEDPESVLCKAVLINNTLKYLQQNGANCNKNHQPPQLLTGQDYDETELDILNKEIQFPSAPLHEQNIPSENEFFNICCKSLSSPDQFSSSDDVLSEGEASKELCRDIESINNLRTGSDNNMTTGDSEQHSYQDQSSKLYNISTPASCTSQSILNLPLHRIVQCKV